MNAFLKDDYIIIYISGFVTILLLNICFKISNKIALYLLNWALLLPITNKKKS